MATAIGAASKPDLSPDEVFNALGNARRRHVIRALEERDVVDKGELAEQIAAVENDTTRDQLTSQQRKRVYIGLHQSHLPTLERADIVDVDGDDVLPGPAHEAALEALANVTEPLDEPTTLRERVLSFVGVRF